MAELWLKSVLYSTQAASVWSTRKVITMHRAVSHQQETIRHLKWFPFDACSRLEWRSLRVSFSFIGPILFLVYNINDLQGSFADDTRLREQILSCDDVIILQEDINNVVKWATENNMLLTDSKFEYLAYRTASRAPVSFLRSSPSLPNGFTTALHRAKILPQRPVSKI